MFDPDPDLRWAFFTSSRCCKPLMSGKTSPGTGINAAVNCMAWANYVLSADAGREARFLHHVSVLHAGAWTADLYWLLSCSLSAEGFCSRESGSLESIQDD